jgi:S1-C subfamily serine protease
MLAEIGKQMRYLAGPGLMLVFIAVLYGHADSAPPQPAGRAPQAFCVSDKAPSSTCLEKQTGRGRPVQSPSSATDQETQAGTDTASEAPVDFASEGLTLDELPDCSATIYGAYGASVRSDLGSEEWLGSCFAVGSTDELLLMVTNRHCLGLDAFIEERVGARPTDDYGLQVLFPSGEVRDVYMMGFQWAVDLAVLGVPIEGLREGTDFTIVPLYEGDVNIGDRVAASGSPSGLYGTVTFGNVSAFRDFDGVPVIQIDAHINSGNSGGPLLVDRDSLYYCIGVNTWDLGETEGIAFAIDLQGAYGEGLSDEGGLYPADISGVCQALEDVGLMRSGPASGIQGRRVEHGSGGTSGGGHRVN